jgi:hypothetical protein
MKKLILSRRDLNYAGRKLPLDEICYYHIAETLEPFKKARFVKIADEDGSEKILKNCYDYKRI